MTGCQKNVADLAPENGQHAKYSRILVFPFQDMTAIYGVDQTVQGPLSGKVFITSPVAPQSAQYLTTEATRRLTQKIAPGTVAAPRDAKEALEVIPSVQHRDELVAGLRQAGRKAGVDAVLIGYVYGFEERVGGDFGVEKPAKISFEVNLINVAAGRLVWQDRFIETQQPLNENLFKIGKFIQRKGRWITAREMGARALEEMISGAEVF